MIAGHRVDHAKSAQVAMTAGRGYRQRRLRGCVAAFGLHSFAFAAVPYRAQRSTPVCTGCRACELCRQHDWDKPRSGGDKAEYRQAAAGCCVTVRTGFRKN